ncbi:MAG: DUF1549 domain-containing protein, partial [Planctomycetes bacterium]|nr:DUF1549 domain-containing protein [Planctomycetota bacterium]
MNDSTNAVPGQVWELLEAVCENRITAAGAQQLEEYVLSDPVVRDLYVDYLTMHGTLHWDVATLPEPLLQLPADVESQTALSLSPSVERPRQSRSGGTKWAYRSALIISACFLVSLGAWLQGMFFAGDSTESRDRIAASSSEKSKSSILAQRNRLAERNRNNQFGKRASTNSKIAKKTNTAKGRRTIVAHKPSSRDHVVVGPAKRSPNLPRRTIAAKAVGRKIRRPVVARRPPPRPFVVPAGGSTDNAVVAYIDFRLKQRWREEMVAPSAIAADGKWLRRVSLDLIGRIPTAEEVEKFRQDPDPGKRRTLVDRLLDDPRYVRNWTTVWSNLLVGQSPNRDVDKPALEKFLRDSFRRNRPWNEIVFDFIAAEGDGRENGAANFLIAHLNNQAVPATAITARLFLGMQIQCTQC